MAQQPPLNPGDEAEPGTPGSGEDVCPPATARAITKAPDAKYAVAPARSCRVSAEAEPMRRTSLTSRRIFAAAACTLTSS